MRGRGIREQDAEDAKDTQKAQKNTKIFKCESRARPHSTQPQTHKSLASSVYAGYREFMGCKAHGGWLSWFCSLLAQGNAGGGTQRAQRLRRGSKRIQKYSNEKAEPDRIKPSRKYQKGSQALFMRVTGHLWAARRMNAGCSGIWLWRNAGQDAVGVNEIKQTQSINRFLVFFCAFCVSFAPSASCSPVLQPYCARIARAGLYYRASTGANATPV